MLKKYYPWKRAEQIEQELQQRQQPARIAARLRELGIDPDRLS